MKPFATLVAVCGALTAASFACPARAETKVTKLALNWEQLPKKANQTENAFAKLPGEAFVYWWRDIENVSTDSFLITDRNGSMCMSTVRSSDPVVLDCGRIDDYLKLTRIAKGIEIERHQTLPEPPPDAAAPPGSEAAPPQRSPSPAPSKAPYRPGHSASKSKTRT